MAMDMNMFPIDSVTPPDAIVVYSDSKTYPAVSIVLKDAYDSSGYRIANSNATNLSVSIDESPNGETVVTYRYRSGYGKIKYKLIYF